VVRTTIPHCSLHGCDRPATRKVTFEVPASIGHQPSEDPLTWLVSPTDKGYRSECLCDHHHDAVTATLALLEALDVEVVEDFIISRAADVMTWLDDVCEPPCPEPLGQRIELVTMNNDPDPLPPGARGTVTGGNSGQVHVRWDDGRARMLIPGEDVWKRVSE
jgi:hypothetical protein